MDDINELAQHFERLFAQDDNSVIENFHERTKWTPVMDRALAQRIQLFLHSPQLRQVIAHSRKNTDAFPRVILPPADLGDVTLRQVIEARRSVANMAQAQGASPGVDDLSAILQFSYGVTGEMRSGAGYPSQPLRATPSAGALYPLEIYVVAREVSGLETGLYHYDAVGHALAKLRSADVLAAFPRNALQPELLERANAILIITAVVARSIAKYRERGYRFIMNDCGALTQSLYLTATARGVSACAWGGFCDDQLADFLNIDNCSEVVCLGFVLGAHLQQTVA